MEKQVVIDSIVKITAFNTEYDRVWLVGVTGTSNGTRKDMEEKFGKIYEFYEFELNNDDAHKIHDLCQEMHSMHAGINSSCYNRAFLYICKVKK